MELVYLLKLLKNKYWMLIVAEVICVTLSLVFAFTQKTSYEAAMNFYIKRKVEVNTDKYYSYDGYYASQVGKEYSDTVVGIFEGLDILRRASDISTKVPKEVAGLQSLSNKINVLKVAPQLVRVTVTTDSKEDSAEIVKALGQSGIERVRLLNQTGDPQLSVDVLDPEPIVSEKKISFVIIGGVAIVLGLVLGIIAVLLTDLVKKVK